MHRNALLIFTVAVLSRFIPALMVYGSADVLEWPIAVALYEQGQDPYMQNTVFNWPPFWLAVVRFLLHGGAIVKLPVHLVVKLLPIMSDGVIALVIYHILVKTGAGNRKAFIGSLFYALNPVSIVITSVHGNFISIPLAFLVLASYSFLCGDKPVHVVLSSLALGCGIMSKIWPAVALPFFLVRIVSWKNRGVFTLLAIMPVVFSLFPIYFINKDLVVDRFITYQSQAGWWGLTGIGQVWPSSFTTAFCNEYAKHGAKVLVIAIIALLFVSRRCDLARTLSVLLLVVVFLMNGFGPQYLVMLLPFAVISGDRWFLPYSMLVTVLFCFEYGLFKIPGCYGIPVTGPPYPDISYDAFLASARITNMLRLPVWLFIGVWAGKELVGFFKLESGLTARASSVRYN